jgi:uncharacterized protein
VSRSARLRVQRALVTGASAGLGASFARQLAARGIDLVVVARRGDRLEDLAASLPVACEVLVADLAEPADLERVEARLRDPRAPVDLLVNNAGFGLYGPVADLDTAAQARMVALNVGALTRSTRAVLPALLERRAGGIINVGSVAGFQPDPFSAVYGATKAYVRSFTEALAVELRGTGVTVTLLAPGITDTEFQAQAGIELSGLPGGFRQAADPVVAAGLAAFARGRVVCVPGLVNQVGAIGSQVLPSRLSRRLSGFAHARLARG